jgi:hypothetical protein
MGGLTLHAKGVRHSHRHGCGTTTVQQEPIVTGLDGQHPLEHDVTLILRVCVKGWRSGVREDELDQRVPVANGLAGHPDRGQRA